MLVQGQGLTIQNFESYFVILGGLAFGSVKNLSIKLFCASYCYLAIQLSVRQKERFFF